MYDKSLETLREDKRDVWDAQGWQDFRTIRKEDWDATLNRHTVEETNLLMHRFGIAANVLTPVIEQALGEHVDILLANTRTIDAGSLDSRVRAKDNVEDIRIAASVSWRNQDRGQRLSRLIYSQMCRYGIAYLYKTWHMPREPKYTARDDEKMLPKDWAQTVLKERGEHYDQSEKSAFGHEMVSPLEMAHWPLENPSLFIQVSVVSYRDVRGQLKRRSDDKRLYLTKSKSILWGDSQPPEELEANNWGGTFMRRIRRAKLDPETDQWHVTEWITDGDSGDLSDQTEELDDYLCPFGMAPYFFAPGGHERVEETQNAHLRYRPILYPLIVKADELNTYRSLLIKATIWLMEHPYGTITLNGVQADTMRAFLAEHPEMGGSTVAEGSGAATRLTWTVANPATDEIPILPNAQPLQMNLDALITSITMVTQEIAELRANRYLVGQGDVDGPPASSVLDQHQAARTPYQGYITSADLMVERWLVAEPNAICYWDRKMKGAKPYTYRTHGDEPYAREPRDAGDVVELTAEKIKAQPWVLSVTTANESDAERAMAEQSADLALQVGAITREQWLKQRGNADPRKQARDLEKERREKMFQQFEDAITQQNIQTYFLAKSGIDLSLVGQQQGMMGGAPPQQGGNGSPTPEYQQPGVHNGTAPLVEGPSSGQPVGGMV